MYICICNAITERQIRQAAESGVDNLWDLQSSLGVASTCGKCGDTAMSILRESGADMKRAEPRIYTPAVA